MLDKDEDAIRSTTPGAENDSDDELDDGTTDYRFLSTTLIHSTDPVSVTPVIPRRGEKNFEPNSTGLQASKLAASRRTMHDALSHTRSHGLKNHVIGLYDGVKATVKVRQVKGQVFRTVGRDLSGGGVELLPEEALWMLERGVLDVRWPVDDDDGEEQEVNGGHEDGEGVLGGQRYEKEKLQDHTTGVVKIMHELAHLHVERLNEKEPTSEEQEIKPTVETMKMHRLVEEQEDQRKEESGIPMSLQGAYAAFLGEEAERGSWLTLDKYLVYAGLKRAGFIVRRTDTMIRCRPATIALKSDATEVQTQETSRNITLFAWLYKMLLAPRRVDRQTIQESQRLGPLVMPGLYRSYSRPAPNSSSVIPH